MASYLLLGIDVGGTGCKVSLYDLNCNLKATHYQETPLLFPGSGLVEADPEAWWKSCLKGIKGVLGQAAGEIAAIGVSGTNATLVVNSQGEPLCPAIMQLDLRSVPLAAEIEAKLGRDKVFAITGNRIAAGTFSLPAILWMKKNLTFLAQTKHTFLVPTGFIVLKLTGRYSIDYSRAATMLLFDYRQKGWAPNLMQDLGISPEELPPLYPPWEVVGGVRPEVAALTGLKEGTPVVAGCMDTVAAMLGAGLARENQALITLGTVGRISMVTKGGEWRAEFLNCHHGIKDKWLSIALINPAGASLRWYRNLVGTDYATLNEEATTIQAGGDGVIFLPYLGGEKSPLWDPQARGIFFGLQLHHTRAHLYRAVLEGVSLAVRHNLEMMEGRAKDLSLYVSGGGAASGLWVRILASVLGRPLMVLKNPETETLGAAWLAGKAIGAITSELHELLETGVAGPVGPEEDWKDYYDKLFKIYQQLYLVNKDLFRYPYEGRHLPTALAGG